MPFQTKTALEHCTVAQLAEVFAGCEEEIMAEWRVQARELLHELHLDKPTLTDHLPDLVAEITRDLAQGREGAISGEQTRGSPPVHGVQRFHDGLDVGEVVAEYNILRVAFITIAERHGLYLVGEAARVINQRIDEGVRMAVTAFRATGAHPKGTGGRASRFHRPRFAHPAECSLAARRSVEIRAGSKRGR